MSKPVFATDMERELYEALLHAEAILARSPGTSTNCNGHGPYTTTATALDRVRRAIAALDGDRINAAHTEQTGIVACRAMIAWDDAEKAGPDYGTLTRDTHPHGEIIWRRWWDDQQRLCAHAFDTARAALTKASKP